jgi:high frequency lysogenization protein
MIDVWEERLLNNTESPFSNWEAQNITLAAVAQCSALVHDLAFTGKANEKYLMGSINPLFVLTPNFFSDVYPDVRDLTLGLSTLPKIITNNRTRKNSEIIRYSLGMFALRKSLMASSKMQAAVRAKLQPMIPMLPLDDPRAAPPGEDLELLKQDRTFRQLSNIYRETISTLSFRIQVAGKAEHLKSENIANRIRALLFAGIRSALLWHQLNGRRWHLVFYRKRIQETSATIKKNINSRTNIE